MGSLAVRLVTHHQLRWVTAGDSALGRHLSSRAGQLQEVRVQLSTELPQEGYLRGQLLAVSELCVRLRLVCVRGCHANPSHTSRSRANPGANFPLVAQGQP